jgi:hypothetical protein
MSLSFVITTQLSQMLWMKIFSRTFDERKTEAAIGN